MSFGVQRLSTMGLVSLGVVASEPESLDVRQETYGWAVAGRSTELESVASEYKNIVGTDQHILAGVLADSVGIGRFAATAHSVEPVRTLVWAEDRALAVASGIVVGSHTGHILEAPMPVELPVAVRLEPEPLEAGQGTSSLQER